MKYKLQKKLYWIFAAILGAGSITTYCFAKTVIFEAYDWGNLVVAIPGFIGSLALSIFVVYLFTRKKVNWRSRDGNIMGGIYLLFFAYVPSSFVITLYAQGLDHTTIKTYANVGDYDDATNQNVILIDQQVYLRIDGLCWQNVIKRIRGSRRVAARNDTTTFFAMPIVKSAQDTTIDGWFLSIIPTREFVDICQNQRYEELVDFSRIKGYSPIDWATDHRYHSIIKSSPLLNDQSATKMAFYARYNLPVDTRYFMWISLAAFIVSIIALHYAAKTFSNVEDY